MVETDDEGRSAHIVESVHRGHYEDITVPMAAFETETAAVEWAEDEIAGEFVVTNVAYYPEEPPFHERVKERIEQDDREETQIVECPAKPCDSRQFVVSALARIGTHEEYGLACAKCGLPILDAKLNNGHPDIVRPSDLMGGGDTDE